MSLPDRPGSASPPHPLNFSWPDDVLRDPVITHLCRALVADPANPHLPPAVSDYLRRAGRADEAEQMTKYGRYLADFLARAQVKAEKVGWTTRTHEESPG
jgi:hypothetical protein